MLRNSVLWIRWWMYKRLLSSRNTCASSGGFVQIVFPRNSVKRSFVVLRRDSLFSIQGSCNLQGMRSDCTYSHAFVAFPDYTCHNLGFVMVLFNSKFIICRSVPYFVICWNHSASSRTYVSNPLKWVDYLSLIYIPKCSFTRSWRRVWPGKRRLKLC